MRKIKLAAIILTAFLAHSVQAQKVEQYCQMVAAQKFLSAKVNIGIDNGEERKLFDFKDRRVKDELGKVKDFNSVVDAMNFLGRAGWKLVNAFPITMGNQNVYHYVFKREFDLSELEEVKDAAAKN